MERKEGCVPFWADRPQGRFIGGNRDVRRHKAKGRHGGGEEERGGRRSGLVG